MPLGAVGAAVIALAGTALVQIGTWQARARRTIRSDLKIAKELPEGSAEKAALIASVLRRTRDLAVRTKRQRLLDRLVNPFHRYLATMAVLALIAVAMYVSSTLSTHRADSAGAVLAAMPEVASSAREIASQAAAHNHLVAVITSSAFVAVCLLAIVITLYSMRFVHVEAQRKKLFPADVPARPEDLD